MRRRFLFALAAMAAIGAAGAALAPEVPRLVPGGARIIPHAPLPPAGQTRIALPAGAVIVCQGDSNTGSQAAGGQRGYPAQLAAALGGHVRVIGRGGGGHTATQGEARWRGAGTGTLAIVMYGSNEAAPRGVLSWLLSGRRPVPLADYRATLQRIVAAHRAGGAHVLVLAPLPAASPAMEARLRPYRRAARQAALAAGAGFLDPVAAFDPHAATLSRDGLHLNDAGQRALARWLAARITALDQPAVDQPRSAP